MYPDELVIFRARPLKKLCEYEGNPLPEDYKSDCYQDVDESEYACKEKYRIMVSQMFFNKRFNNVFTDMALMHIK